MTRGRTAALFLAVLFCPGCMMGPDYRRPPVSIPPAYRGPAGEAEPAGPGSFGNMRWWEVFHDPELQRLLKQALDRNYDILLAASRIEQAGANVGITRADQFPQLAAGAAFTRSRISGAAVPFLPGFKGVTNSIFGLTASASWALDFWGQYRRATEAARAQLLASRSAQLAVRTSLVAFLATAYFQLRELDLELEITRRELVTREASLELTRIREQGGVASLLDVRQSESLVTTATAAIPQIQQRIEEAENQINTLLGNYPGDVIRGLPLDQQAIPRIPEGLPSELLARRPDIRQAEENLMAANARIGVARAAYFPSVALTGDNGFQAADLSALISRRAWVWSFAPSVSVPVFTAGRIRSTVRLVEAQWTEALLSYEQTVQLALRDVSNALIAVARTRQFRAQQEALTRIYRDAARLSEIRYRGGVTNYLEVLDSERNVYSAELTLAQARLNELSALVQLYSALGGGWQE